MKSLHAFILLGAVAACTPEPAPSPPPATDIAAPAVFTAGDPPAAPQAFAEGGGALGSGCAPGATTLPDGAWFGYATRWDATGIDFDLACFYVGDAAAAQATARQEESPPPNDYYLVNETATTRRLDIAPDALAYRLVAAGGSDLERASYADLVANPVPESTSFCPGESCAIWVFVNNGHVTEVMSQFFP